jgi:hypothetical protein
MIVLVTTKQKEEKRKNQSPRNRKACHNVSPLEKRRGDRNPECHEEQVKDVA